MSELAIFMLGPLAITLDGRPLDGLRIRPAVALCVYLACRPERHRRDHLMTLFWPDWPQTSAQQNLRQTVYTLRQALPEVTSYNGHGSVPLILAERETLQLNPEAAVAVDIHRFASLIKQATPDALVEAVALYRGDFLADFYLPDSNPFEDWAVGLRQAFRRMALDSLERLVENARQDADFPAAEGYARRQLEIDNLREGAHRQLMLALAHSGQRAASLTHYEAYRRLVKEELGIEPSDDIRTLAERIAQGKEAPAIKRANSSRDGGSRHNLPAQMTPFLGREQEVDEIIGLVREPVIRLLTLTGVGGTGKTRLALEVASQVSGDFEDGVVFVPLETLFDPTQILPELMRALGMKEKVGESSVNTVKAYLRDRRLMLVLDNFEQIVDGAPIISDLLRAAPDVKALITSREELRIYGEYIYAVPPMSLPPEGARTVSSLAGIDSVRLFVQRVRSVRREFKLTDYNAADIAAICYGLDGLPLAIELAAAQLKRMTPAQLRAKLSSRLSLLASDLRDVSSRQRTLREMIDWSYDLLSVEERVLFARLGIFVGGCTLKAAEEITAGDPIADVLIGLDSLLDKNLIRVWDDSNGDRRYGMLETFREYAVEKLKESGEDDRLAERHLSYFFSLRESIPTSTNVPELHRLWSVEQANYLAASEWGSRQDDISMAVRLAATTSFVWEANGWYREALDYALRFRALPGIVEPLWIASAIRVQAAGKAIFLREYDLARELLLEALEFDRAGNEFEDEIHALIVLGRVDIEEGKYAAGLVIHEQAQQLVAECSIYVPDSLVAWSGEALLALGQLEPATTILETFAGQSKIPNDSGLIWPRRAELELMRGRYDAARETLLQGHEPVRSRVRIWRNLLVGVTGWLLERPASTIEDLKIATRLLGANAALTERTGDPLSAFYWSIVERRAALARERLDLEEFQAAWDEGMGWSEEEADRKLVSALEKQD